MTALGKILHEIDLHAIEFESFGLCDDYVSVGWVKNIIKKHLSENKCSECSRRKFYQMGYEDGNKDNDGWIPVERELPPNAKYKGALCPRYQLDTKYGVTEGWYNPDLESWFVLVWFMTERYLNSEIDFENGAHPKIVRCENEVNERHRIVLAWRPLPEPYRPEKEEQKNDRE